VSPPSDLPHHQSGEAIGDDGEAIETASGAIETASGAIGTASGAIGTRLPDDRPTRAPTGRSARTRSRRRAAGGAAPARPASSHRLAARPPGTSRFLVLGAGELSDDIVALDLDTGVLARLHGGLPCLPDGTVEPFDVVDGLVDMHGTIDDPARPEARMVVGQLVRAGTSRGRAVRRLLRGTVAPAEPHLLGFPGSTWPYWELHGGRPSVAIVAPTRGPMLFLRSEDSTCWVRFGWHRTDNWLPVQDRRAVAALTASGRRRLAGKALAAALGFRPAYLVVAVGRPRSGYCTKTVLSILPRH